MSSLGSSFNGEDFLSSVLNPVSVRCLILSSNLGFSRSSSTRHASPRNPCCMLRFLFKKIRKRKATFEGRFAGLRSDDPSDASGPRLPSSRLFLWTPPLQRLALISCRQQLSLFSILITGLTASHSLIAISVLVCF